MQVWLKVKMFETIGTQKPPLPCKPQNQKENSHLAGCAILKREQTNLSKPLHFQMSVSVSVKVFMNSLNAYLNEKW